jgi:hypothetical protein
MATCAAIESLSTPYAPFKQPVFLYTNCFVGSAVKRYSRSAAAKEREGLILSPW